MKWATEGSEQDKGESIGLTLDSVGHSFVLAMDQMFTYTCEYEWLESMKVAVQENQRNHQLSLMIVRFGSLFQFYFASIVAKVV